MVRLRSEEERRPLSAGPGPGAEHRPRPDNKRLSAAADISQFRAESSSTTTTTRSSSILQDSSKSSQQRRSQSRTSRLSSRTSSRLDTTGSSGILNSSLDENSIARHSESTEEHKRRQSDSRSSYYFGEAPDLKEIIASVNGNHGEDVDICDSGGKGGREVGPISPHTGEVVRIRVPFTKEDTRPGQFSSAENIQRLSHQQISPSYNGHKVTIMVNRSNETLAAKFKEVSLGNTQCFISFNEVNFQASADISTINKLKTSSAQNLTGKSSSGENGHLSDFSRETFF